jgi:hypothetical protein
MPPTMAASNEPQLMRQQAMEAADDERAFQGIILSLGWLLERDVSSVSMVNRRALLPAARDDYLWEASLSKLEELPLHDNVDVSAVDFPTDFDKEIMSLPPRIHGERRADRWRVPHCRDRVARRHPKGPLVLYGAWKIENGKLYDGFVQDDDRQLGSQKEVLWLERDFPIHCNSCRGVTLNSSAELFQHCGRYEHIFAAQKEEERVPAEFVDPRHNAHYQTLSTFDKARVLSEYQSMVVAYFRAPMSEAALANMEGIVEMVKRIVFEIYEPGLQMDDETGLGLLENDFDAALNRCTLERTVNACIEEFAVKKFYEYGAGTYYDIIRNGWESFQLHDTDDKIRLAARVSDSRLVRDQLWF